MLTIVVVGVLLWLINTYVPMQAAGKKILKAVVVIGLIILDSERLRLGRAAQSTDPLSEHPTAARSKRIGAQICEDSWALPPCIETKLQRRVATRKTKL